MTPNPSQDIAVLGASGATGRLLVAELLSRSTRVRALVRSAETFYEALPPPLRDHDALRVIQASVTDLTEDQLAEHLRGCTGAASTLGHNLTLRGIYGKPRRLVADTARRVCHALACDPDRRRGAGEPPARFVLMGSAGVRHRGQHEPVPLAQHAVLMLLRLLVPPHADNEHAAQYLRTHFPANTEDAAPTDTAPEGLTPEGSTSGDTTSGGAASGGSTSGGAVRWVVVRPDTLVDHAAVSPYDACPAPTRSAIFNTGQTSRINVAHFIAELLTDNARFTQWDGKMPVLYNRT